MQLESSLHEEDLLLCNHEEREAGRRLGVWGDRSENSVLGAHSGSFWHHLGCTLIGPGACLEHGQGQAPIWKSGCAQRLWKVGHVEHIAVVPPLPPSLPPTPAMAGVSAQVGKAPDFSGPWLVEARQASADPCTGSQTSWDQPWPYFVDLVGFLGTPDWWKDWCKPSLSQECLQCLQKLHEKGERTISRLGLHKPGIHLGSERSLSFQLRCRKLPYETAIWGRLYYPSLLKSLERKQQTLVSVI